MEKYNPNFLKKYTGKAKDFRKVKGGYTSDTLNSLINDIDRKCLVEGIETTLSLIKRYEKDPKTKEKLKVIISNLYNTLTFQIRMKNLKDAPDTNQEELEAVLKQMAKEHKIPYIKI